MNKKGRLIVVTGPSGVGKTTLLKRLLNEYKDRIVFSVSHTTRSMRNGEINGVDYFFESEEEFKKRIENDEFLEYAIVHNNYYGTSKKQVMDVINSGKDCLLDIDVQGAMNLMSKGIDAIYIFIAPPSLETLKERLVKRATDSKEVIERRLKNAEKELSFQNKYQYIIVNNELDLAYNQLKEILYKN